MRASDLEYEYWLTALQRHLHPRVAGPAGCQMEMGLRWFECSGIAVGPRAVEIR